MEEVDGLEDVKGLFPLVLAQVLAHLARPVVKDTCTNKRRKKEKEGERRRREKKKKKEVLVASTLALKKRGFGEGRKEAAGECLRLSLLACVCLFGVLLLEQKARKAGRMHTHAHTGATLLSFLLSFLLV